MIVINYIFFFYIPDHSLIRGARRFISTKYFCQTRSEYWLIWFIIEWKIYNLKFDFNERVRKILSHDGNCPRVAPVFITLAYRSAPHVFRRLVLHPIQPEITSSNIYSQSPVEDTVCVCYTAMSAFFVRLRSLKKKKDLISPPFLLQGGTTIEKGCFPTGVAEQHKDEAGCRLRSRLGLASITPKTSWQSWVSQRGGGLCLCWNWEKTSYYGSLFKLEHRSFPPCMSLTSSSKLE